MLPKHWGSAESQFENALLQESYRPPWLVDIERASAILDVRGVDWIAYVWHRKYAKPIRVPIQIKGSTKGAEEYYQKHLDARKAGVVILIVQRTDRPVSIVSRLVEKLHEVRQRETVDFDAYLKRISTCPLKRHESLMLARIIQGRKTSLQAEQFGAAPAE